MSEVNGLAECHLLTNTLPTLLVGSQSFLVSAGGDDAAAGCAAVSSSDALGTQGMSCQIRVDCNEPQGKRFRYHCSQWSPVRMEAAVAAKAMACGSAINACALRSPN